LAQLLRVVTRFALVAAFELVAFFKRRTILEMGELGHGAVLSQRHHRWCG